MKNHVVKAVWIGFAVVMVACGKGSAPPGDSSSSSLPQKSLLKSEDGIYSAWVSSPVKDSGVTFTFELRYTKDRAAGDLLTSVATCTPSDGVSVKAVAQARVVITDHSVRTLEAMEVSDPSHNCRSKIDIGEVTYRIDGDKLVLSAADEDQDLILSRVTTK